MKLDNSYTLEQFIEREILLKKLLPNHKINFMKKKYLYSGCSFSFEEILPMQSGLRIIDMTEKSILLIDNELYKIYNYIISNKRYKDRIIIFKYNDVLYYELDLPIKYGRCQVIDIYTKFNYIIIEFNGDNI